MSEPSRDLILKALEGVIDPELRRPVTELDMVREVEIDGGDVRVTIALTVAGCPLRDPSSSRSPTCCATFRESNASHSGST